MMILIAPAPAFASELVRPELLPEVKRAFEYVFNEKYEKAEEIFTQYINKYPDRPEGYFFMAGIYAEQINSYHDHSRMGIFQKWANLTIQKSEVFISLHPEEPAGFFYLGSIYGYQGLLDAQNQNMVQAFMRSLKAKKNLEKTLQIAPNAYDCYYGLGMIYYYASKKSAEEGGFVRWIIETFITGNKDLRQEGIAMLKKAWTAGGISSDFAYSGLMWISLIEGKMDDAFRMAEDAIRRWPRDKHGYWVMGRVHLIQGMCQNALDDFGMARKLVLEQPTSMDKFAELQVALDIARLCVEINGSNEKVSENLLRSVSIRLRGKLNVQLEYANSKGVVISWLSLLDSLQKLQNIRAYNKQRKG